VSHVPDFEGKSPIPTIHVLAQALSIDSADASSRGPSATALKM
jgi:hypothetical protein